MVTALKRRTPRKPAAGEWSCRKCKAITTSKTPRCGQCQQLGHPVLRPAKSKTTKAPAAEAPRRWKCPGCRGETPHPNPFCNVCQRVTNPRLNPLQAQIAFGITPTDAAEKLWLRVHIQGADDAAIAQTLRQVLQVSGGCQSDEGDIGWIVSEDDISMWFESKREKRRSQLSHFALLSGIRIIYQIPGPVGARPAEGGSAELTSEGKEIAKAAVGALNGAKRSTKTGSWTCRGCGSSCDSKARKCSKCRLERTEFVAPSASKATADPDAGALDLRDDEPRPAMLRVAVELIVPRNNPRKHFDDEAMEQLAESIRQNDVIEPLVVRPKGPDGLYELLAGERRLRGAIRAGKKDVPVVVRACDDAEAAKIRLIENFVREDLNALEEAEAFQQITAAGVTQKELADELRLTQAHISNRIRLLELPDEWKTKLISQEISATQARALIPWSDRQPVLDELQRLIKDQQRYNDSPISVSHFENLIQRAARNQSRPLKPRGDFEGLKFKPTSEQLAQLDVVKWKDGGNTHERCFNVVLWEVIQEELKNKAAARKAQRDESAGGKGSGSSGKPTAAELKAKAAEAKKKTDRRVYWWRVRWYQRQISTRLPETKDASLLTRCALYFACASESGRREEELENAAEAVGAKRSTKRNRYHSSSTDVWKTLASIPAARTDELLRHVLAKWWQHDAEEYRRDLDASDVEGLAVELGADLKKHWTVSRDFLELFTKTQLWELAGDWDIVQHKAWIAAGKKEKRDEVIEALLKVDQALTGAKRRLPAPKCLLEAKGA